MLAREEFFARCRNSRFAGFSIEQMYSAYEAYVTCPVSPYQEIQTGIRKDEFSCGQCGNCCKRDWRVEVSLADVIYWINEYRIDLLTALEHSPRGGDYGPTWVDDTMALHIADRMAGAGEDTVAMALTIAFDIADQEGSYVLPKNEGCKYLKEGPTAACMIYEARPEVCRGFPGRF